MHTCTHVHTHTRVRFPQIDFHRGLECRVTAQAEWYQMARKLAGEMLVITLPDAVPAGTGDLGL